MTSQSSEKLNLQYSQPDRLTGVMVIINTAVLFVPRSAWSVQVDLDVCNFSLNRSTLATGNLPSKALAIQWQGIAS